MDFGLSQAQALLQRSIADYLSSSVPLERVREVMESENGFDPAIYQGLAEQGVTGLMIDPEYGGSGLGLLEASLAAQELGRHVTPIAFHTSCVLAPILLEACATAEQKKEWLGGIADGSRLVAPIFEATLGIQDEKLSGTALFIQDGHNATALLVRSGRSLYLVPRDGAGVSVTGLHNVDQTRRLSEVRFDDVALNATEHLPQTLTAEVHERALQAVRIMLAADALGASQQALKAAVEYAMGREQFDRIIASFQAVKHMCAEVAADTEPVQSLLWHAAHSWDGNSPDTAWLAPLVKAHATEVASNAVTKTTQVFGGIGFTWECDMHLWYKRAGYDRQLFGHPAAMRRLAADLQLGGATG